MVNQVYLKVRLALGCLSVLVGFLAANIALFRLVYATDIYHLLGQGALYICAYGGFGAMIFGSMMINDYAFNRTKPAKIESTTEAS